jgi:branched-subunit amino acid aminotransferase/4-amino-4-deoxychorismate lyase
VLVELCGQLVIPLVEREIAPEALQGATGVFVTLSSFGVVECNELDGVALARSSLVARLREAYDRLITGG